MFQKIYQKLQTREGLMLVASLAIVVFTVGFILGDFPGRKGADAQPSTITVSGQGETFAVPDVATFNFTVSQDAKTMADAQGKVSDIGNKLVATLKSKGIEAKDIKTEGFNAYPKYENKSVSPISACTPTYCPGYNTNPVIVGYTVSHTYSVKVRDLDKASDIAKTLTDSGASSISGPDFTVDDIQKVQNEARDKAIADAKTQARVLARQLGVRLVEIVDFQVVGSGPIYPMYAKATMAQGADAAVPAPAIEPGQTDVKVQVQITYRIR
jgi:uncharacterized protein YggE